MARPPVHAACVSPPAAGWNGKLQVVGNGGFAGTISYEAMANAVAAGYASASTDTMAIFTASSF